MTDGPATDVQDTPDFRHVEAFVFDLDNTLYPAECNLFAEIDTRMRAFISRYLGVDQDEARHIQKKYYREHGTTLSGLMRLHGMKPEAFLDFVHDIDLSALPDLPDLGAGLARLPGRRIVFTNGTVAHARRVLARLGVEDHFEDVFDIVASDYVPKPDPSAFARFVDRLGIDPHRSAMFEDLARNLTPARALGMTTVLVEPQGGHADPAVRNWQEHDEAAASVQYRTQDLAAFLNRILVKTPHDA